MPLFFDEAHARRMLDMPAVIEALRVHFLSQADGGAQNVPRTRAPVFDRSLNVTAASEATSERFAVKLYGAAKSHILLYAKSGDLLAVMASGWLGQLRTGAASGLATALMAREDAGRVGLIGAGRQAQTQLAALAAVGKLHEARVFARRRDALEEFCARMEKQLARPVQPASDARAAVSGADIIVTATKSSTPVLERAWVSPGAHINAIGANAARRMELQPDIVRDAALVATDDVAQARKEAAEFIALDNAGGFDWNAIAPLSALVRSGAPPRERDAVTVFKSLGVGLEDLAIASLLFDRSAREALTRPSAG